jgi:transcriptional regulator with XRE-family HTH domain
MSLQEVEEGSGQEFKASVLGAYERGERAISVPRLQRLARFYGVPVDRLLPVDDVDGVVDLVAAEDPDERRAGNTGLTIDLTRVDGLPEPHHSLLSRYVTTIQLQRHDFNGRVLTLRRDDVRALACMLEMTPSTMTHWLDELGLTRIP